MAQNDCQTCGEAFCEHFFHLAATDTLLGAQYRGALHFALYRMVKDADATGDFTRVDDLSHRLAQAQYAAYGDDIA